MIIIVFSMPFRRFVQFILEQICAKRPIVGGNLASYLLSREPTVWEHQNLFSKSVSDLISNNDRSEIASDVEGGARSVSNRSEIAVPYRLAYFDTLSNDEEVNVLIAAAKEFFNSTLEIVPLPWREQTEEVAATAGGRQLVLMGAIMR